MARPRAPGRRPPALVTCIPEHWDRVLSRVMGQLSPRPWGDRPADIPGLLGRLVRCGLAGWARGCGVHWPVSVAPDRLAHAISWPGKLRHLSVPGPRPRHTAHVRLGVRRSHVRRHARYLRGDRVRVL